MRSATSKQRLPLARALARLPGQVAAVTLEAVTTLGELDITARDTWSRHNTGRTWHHCQGRSSRPDERTIHAYTTVYTFYTLDISRRRRRPLTLLWGPGDQNCTKFKRKICAKLQSTYVLSNKQTVAVSGIHRRSHCGCHGCPDTPKFSTSVSDTQLLAAPMCVSAILYLLLQIASYYMYM